MISNSSLIRERVGQRASPAMWSTLHRERRRDHGCSVGWPRRMRRRNGLIPAASSPICAALVKKGHSLPPVGSRIIDAVSRRGARRCSTACKPAARASGVRILRPAGTRVTATRPVGSRRAAIGGASGSTSGRKALDWGERDAAGRIDRFPDSDGGETAMGVGRRRFLERCAGLGTGSAVAAGVAGGAERVLPVVHNLPVRPRRMA